MLGEEILTCDQCNKVFGALMGLKGHKESAHNVEDMKHVECCLCSESFGTLRMLAEHCDEEHLDDGAHIRSQDYTIHDVSFETFDAYKVRENLL